MKHVIAGNIKILYNNAGKSSVDLFANACTKSIPVIYETWGLKAPANCKVYIMTSWQSYLFQTLSWAEKFFLVVVLPISLPQVYMKMSKSWRLFSGWTVPSRPNCWIKTLALVNMSSHELRDKVHIQETDPDNIVRLAICHELTHAFSVHLKLPLWLSEGIAMYTTDKFAGKITVKAESLKYLEPNPHKNRSTNYTKLTTGDDDRIAYNYARGYWLTRYLEHNFPGFIRGLLVKRQSKRKIEQQLSLKTGIPVKDFWNEIDKKIVAQFAL